MALSTSTFLLFDETNESSVEELIPLKTSSAIITESIKTKINNIKLRYREEEKQILRETDEEQRRCDKFKLHIQLIESAKQLDYKALHQTILSCGKLSKPSYLYRNSIHQGLPKNAEKKTAIHSILANGQLSDDNKKHLITLLLNKGYIAFNTELIRDMTIINQLATPAFSDLFNEMYLLLMNIEKQPALWTTHQEERFIERLMLSSPVLANKIAITLTHANKIKLLSFLLYGNAVTAEHAEQFALNWIHSLDRPEKITDCINAVEKLLTDQGLRWNVAFDYKSIIASFRLDFIKKSAALHIFKLQLIELTALVNKSAALSSQKSTKEIILDTISMIKSLNHPIDVINAYSKIQKIFATLDDPKINQSLKLINKTAKQRILAIDIFMEKPELSAQDELKILNFLNTHQESVFFSFWPTRSRMIYDKIHEENRPHEAQRKYAEEEQTLNLALNKCLR